jgi:hypothetical protein
VRIKVTITQNELAWSNTAGADASVPNPIPGPTGTFYLDTGLFVQFDEVGGYLINGSGKLVDGDDEVSMSLSASFDCDDGQDTLAEYSFGITVNVELDPSVNTQWASTSWAGAYERATGWEAGGTTLGRTHSVDGCFVLDATEVRSGTQSNYVTRVPATGGGSTILMNWIRRITMEIEIEDLLEIIP